MKSKSICKPALRRISVGILTLATAVTSTPISVLAQTRPSAAPPSAPPNGGPSRGTDIAGASSLRGRPVEDVRVLGNTQVSTPVILNLVRTHPGDKFDPITAQEDYQRIYGLRKFSNVEAKVEPTATGGVVVVFIVSEEKQLREIVLRGNLNLDEKAVRGVIEVKPGEAIDRFRIALARQAIETLYKDKNFPFAHVDIDSGALMRDGSLIFNIIEGPNVRVRKVQFKGNRSFTDDRLKEQIQTKSWIFIFRPGTYDPSQIDDDVASVRRYYQQKGFFDARVGRKIIFSPDMTEAQVDFVVEEGVRYTVDKVVFKGNASVPETELRAKLKMVEGRPFDSEILQRDVREVVRAYSPYGFIYQPGSSDPDYLRIGDPSRNPFLIDTVFRKEAGRVQLVYNISEGKPFRTGRIIVKGNAKTQDKVILREMRVQPGQLYNSGELQDATDRLRGVPGLFTGVNITPTGDDPNVRDVLVEVQEGRTASFNLGAGVNSNGGVGGNISYEQKNFDIGNPPSSVGEFFSDKAFTGAGQTFRISLEPGTTQTNASIRFYDPYVFDQPYGFGAEAYLRNRIREDYSDRRLGARVSLEKRFNYTWSARVSLRGEDVDIGSIQDKEVRAQEILDADGNHTLTSIGLSVRRDTTNRGIIPYQGTTTNIGWESFGALGGDTFQRLTLGFDYYKTLSEDLLERKTIFAFHSDAGYIFGNDPFYERFYGGGIGSIRGFSFRGVSPRSGPEDDRIGGDFMATASAEVSFPLMGEGLRGVVFTDVGTVERDIRLGTIRSSVGAGVRLTLPILGQLPIAIDFAIPLSKNSEDDTQFISFSLGFQQ